MVLINHFLTDPVINGIPFSESEVVTPEGLRSFFISLVTFRETSVYWYVFAYILIVLIWPLLRGLGAWIDKAMVREIGFLVITFVLLSVNDYFGNRPLHLGYTGIFVLIPAAIEVIWGHIIFRHRDFLLRPAMVMPELILTTSNLALLAGGLSELLALVG